MGNRPVSILETRLSKCARAVFFRSEMSILSTLRGRFFFFIFIISPEKFRRLRAGLIHVRICASCAPSLFTRPTPFSRIFLWHFPVSTTGKSKRRNRYAHQCTYIYIWYMHCIAPAGNGQWARCFVCMHATRKTHSTHHRLKSINQQNDARDE